ncbi:MAG: hypothetical protein RLZZ241_1789 [Bacteroidota bacterium]|jgi:hypothetical protein
MPELTLNNYQAKTGKSLENITILPFAADYKEGNYARLMNDLH